MVMDKYSPVRVMDMDHDYDQVYDEYNSSWGCTTEGQSNG